MVALPYIHTRAAGGQYAAYFAIVLDSIAEVPHHTESFSRTLLNQQADFIATLFGIGTGASLELRFLSEPHADSPMDGSVVTALRLKVSADDAEAAQREALCLFRAFMPNLLSLSDLYNWRVVESGAEYRRIVREKTDWQVRELLRRERYLYLERLPDEQTPHNIGFVRDNSPRGVKKPGMVYVNFPFLRNYETLQGLFTELLHQPQPVVISVNLAPTRASDEEYQFLQDQLLNCERYIQLPISGSVTDPAVFFPTLRQQSAQVASQVQNALNTLRDAVFLTTVHVLSEAPISRMLCESIGVTATEHVQTTDPESDISMLSHATTLQGGFDWVSPESEAESRRTVRRLRAMSYAGLPAGLLKRSLRIRRLFDVNQASCVFRLPVPRLAAFPGLATTRVQQLPPPPSCDDGLLLGINNAGNGSRRVNLRPEDRLRHTYVIGKTGTGKSTFLKNCIMQDILAGEGVGVFDPHGELIDEVLPLIPKARITDVVLIKPELTDRSVGLNLLDVDTELEKDSVINYLIEVFAATFNLELTGGPVFEMYFRNTLLALMSGGGEPATIMDVHRFFSDRKFREEKIRDCDDSQVSMFWDGIANRAPGELSFSAVAPYVVSKLVRLTHTHLMRRIVGQRKSTIDFTDILEGRRVLLVDLSKGQLGTTSSAFLGMTLIKLLQIAAFRRGSAGSGGRPVPFYVYVDEFQNLATPTFLDLLSESRKYGLAMTLANQYIQQVPNDIRNAITGNVGTLLSFRVGLEDAEWLKNAYAPAVTTSHFVNLPNFNAYVSMLRDGEVCRPFNLATEKREYARFATAEARIMRGMRRYTREVG